MDNRDFIDAFAALLEVPAERITDSFKMAAEAHWDSLALLSTMALIDKHYQRVVDPMAIQAAETFGELKTLIQPAEA
jgi:acyl carrier protein